MTKEEKQLILTDLCARLPYKVIVEQHLIGEPKETNINYTKRVLQSYMLGDFWQSVENVILMPYLRPMSSMTEEEKSQYNFYLTRIEYAYDASKLIDWLNRKMFDYRGLIPKGAALEALEGMYGKEEQQ